ncbi:MAG: hypothetical protein C4B58_03060 [Deltaproteobacteria bacterium]|nr:MAG: hypothetical protein C4B58_03060 [Deltaproteobacteria bacterium]
MQRSSFKRTLRNRSHSLAADRLLQGFNRGQGCTKRRILNGLCFETRKRLLAVRGGEVNNYHIAVAPS